MIGGRDKYIRTHRLGEGVIFTIDATLGQWAAALIIKQHSELVVDLMVIHVDGRQEVMRSIEHDAMAEKPRTWSARPKT